MGFCSDWNNIILESSQKKLGPLNFEKNRLKRGKQAYRRENGQKSRKKSPKTRFALYCWASNFVVTGPFELGVGHRKVQGVFSKFRKKNVGFRQYCRFWRGGVPVSVAPFLGKPLQARKHCHFDVHASPKNRIFFAQLQVQGTNFFVSNSQINPSDNE